ncbi:unnamed protein product, partial [Owenia fusiformis]
EIDGIICVAIDDQQEDVVVKIHRTIIRPSKKNQTIREARDDVHHDPRCTTNPCSNASSSVQYNTQFTSPPDASTRRTVQSPQSNDRKRKQYSPDHDTHTQKTIKIEEPEIIEEDLTGDTDLNDSGTYYNHHSARNALDPTINDNVKHKHVEGIEYALEESEPNISLNKTQAEQMASIKQGSSEKQQVPENLRPVTFNEIRKAQITEVPDAVKKVVSEKVMKNGEGYAVCYLLDVMFSEKELLNTHARRSRGKWNLDDLGVRMSLIRDYMEKNYNTDLTKIEKTTSQKRSDMRRKYKNKDK